jgi:hypothetical protein
MEASNLRTSAAAAIWWLSSRSRKAVAPKSSLKVCLGSRHHSMPIIPHVLHDWHSKTPNTLYTKLSTSHHTQSDQINQPIAWQPLLTNIDLQTVA